MTADEAKQALKEGKKVRCVKWWSHEYIEMEYITVDQKGSKLYGDVFEDNEDDDWEIVDA